MYYRKKYKEYRGITLIALVITILVLLILAGVAIATLGGENGIIARAKTAQSESAYKKAEEEIRIVLNAYQTEKYKTNGEDFIRYLDNAIAKKEIDAYEDKSIEDGKYILKRDKYQFEVNAENLEIISGSENETKEEEYIVVGGDWNTTKAVNSPKLENGMIPIKYVNGSWVICSENDKGWYNYVAQEDGIDGTSYWANVMLSDGKYKTSNPNEYKIDGTTKVENEDLGSMFVWIPRYAYNIVSGYHTDSDTGGTIEIEFLKGTTNESSTGRTTYNNASGQGNWNIHPAFNFGGTPISGLWIAKFEASNSSNRVKIIPNTSSWRNITLGDSFTECLKMSNTNAEIYGISADTNEIDPHLMKNTEWGAVSYFTQSNYGMNKKQVSANENSDFITGAGNYELNVNQSTTGNITGIFDINGGGCEILAAYFSNGNSNATSLVNAATKYKDVYNEAYTNKIYGDAIYETSNINSSGKGSWYKQHAYSVDSGGPFFSRGGYKNSSDGGIFYFTNSLGDKNNSASFRPVIVVY